jgi:hypothetical protein
LHAALKREAADIIAIGDLLIEAHNQLDHGEWLPWLAENFGSSVSTADNYMAAARLAAKYPSIGNLRLRPTALYPGVVPQWPSRRGLMCSFVSGCLSSGLS